MSNPFTNYDGRDRVDVDTDKHYGEEPPREDVERMIDELRERYIKERIEKLKDE